MAGEGDLAQEFRDRYAIVGEPVMRRVERRVIGADYGATSYTTRDQADFLAAMLDLGPGKLLLDLGSGAGWPGIYLARVSGCRVVLADVPLEGLRVAAERVAQEGVDAHVVAGGGEALPLRSAAFDAVTSSDVLC